ncbi:MAG TPA: metalloregulator ArsR/SmtB family transcription factor [Rhizomicrobium sp.]|jgi:DNA-binding transcriptional ArsR family regulator
MMMHVELLQALADPTRLQIVGVMKRGECAVAEIVDRVAIHQSGVSRHLRILHEAGIVQVRPDGQRRLYSLRPEPFQEIDAWIEGFRRLWDERLDRFGAALERRKITARKEKP